MEKNKQLTENKWGYLNRYSKFNKRNYVLTALFIVVLFVILQFTYKPDDIFSYTTTIYINILISILLAVSLNISVGLMGQLNLGHAGFMAVGAYTAALVSKSMVSSGLPDTLQLLISSILGGIIALIFGILLAASTLRLRGDYLAIITLAFGEIIKYVIQNLDFLGGAAGLKSIPTITKFPSTYFIVVLSVIAMTMIMTSKKGREILSIRENEIAAENIGININRTKLYGFGVSAFFAGIAGSLFAHSLGILTPDKFGFMYSIEILVMVVFGGLGSITGSVISATLLTLLNEGLREVSQFRYLVYAIILIVLMIFRPTGIFGTKEFTIPRFVNKVKKIKNKTLNKK